MTRIRTLAAFFLLLRAAAGEEADLAARLAPDPAIARMGELPNGMRYWIRPHDRPPGKAGLYFHVGTGSLNEEEDQRGLAHFLEHLAFNGSEHFPPGSVVPFFEGLGLRFGQHQNAFTSFDQTTYILSLPDAKKETLEKALLFFSDVAFRLSLSPEEIEKERAVILEEARARKGAEQRMREKLLPAFAPGSLLARRIPIGTEEVVSNAKRDTFLAYYRKWYRPDRCALLVCGEIDPAVVEPMVKAAFGDWKRPEEPARPADPGIRPFDKLRAAVITDPEAAGARVSADAVRPLRSVATIGDFRALLVDRLGTWIVKRRLDRLAQRGDAPYESAGIDVEPYLNCCLAASAEVRGAPERWEPMLRALLRELRRVHVHGFLDEELAEAKRALLSAAEQAARAEPTLDASRLLGRMNQSFATGQVPTSAEQGRGLAERLLPGIGRAEAEAAFRASFPCDPCLVALAMPEGAGQPPPAEERVLEIVRAALAEEVPAEEKRAAARPPLDEPPTPGEVKEQSEDGDTGILSATLANGVRVHLRSMDFRKRTVLVNVKLIGGDLEETAQNRGITYAAAVAFQEGRAATRGRPSGEISDFLSGKKTSVAGGVDKGGLLLSLRGDPLDVEEGFRLLHALLKEPRVEAAALDAWRTQIRRFVAMVGTEVAAQVSLKVDALLSGDDVRLKMLKAADIDRVTVESAQAWLDRLVRTCPIEASIVGDLPRHEALRLARTYLGSLPPRPLRRPDLDELR
ncbi:MAG: insulinase family protein, partial [Planctomycetota bacterium]